MRSALSALLLAATSAAVAPQAWAAAPDKAPDKASPRPAPKAPPAAEDPTTEARARFRKGTELYKQARYRDAIAEFEAAYRLRPHGVIFFNLAQCHERLGDIPAALQSYHQYLRAVPDAEDRPTVHAAMANLEARLGASGVQQLLVYSDPSGAEVVVDGQSKGRTPMALVLPHGSHAVSLLRQGYRTSTRQVVLSPQSSLALDLVLQKLEPGELAGVPSGVGTASPTATSTATSPAEAAGSTTAAPRIALAPAPPAPAARARGGRLWTWVAAGAAVAAVGAGGYYGMKARDAQDRLQAGGHSSQAAAQQLKDDATGKARTANLLYGVGAAAGAAGVALFFIEGSF